MLSTLFCDYVDTHDCGLWYKIEPTSSRFFFANSQQTRCTEKLIIHMYDKAWNVRATEFDIVEEGNVPLLMSLPQMRNLGFSFWAITTAVIPELYTAWNVEIQAQDVKEHSFSYGLPRHCLVHECSLFQDTWSTEFLLSMWTFWIQSVVGWNFCLCYWWWLGNWLPQERIDPSPQDLS